MESNKTKDFFFSQTASLFIIIRFRYQRYCVFHPTWPPPDNSVPLSDWLNDDKVFGGNVDQSNTHLTDDITARMVFFKTVPRPLFAPYDESSLVPHEDADFLTRCEGHDSQIIWLKQRRLSTLTRVLFSGGSQCGRLAGSLKGERIQYW